MQQCNRCICTSARQHKTWTALQIRASSPYMAQQQCMHVVTAKWPQCSASYCCTSVNALRRVDRKIEWTQEQAAECWLTNIGAAHWITQPVPFIASPMHHVLHAHFSRSPVARNHRQHFFDPVGSNTITIVHRIEKNVWTIAIAFDPIGSNQL